MTVRATRSPRDYRGVGVMFDTARKPMRRGWDLTVSLWWWDVQLSW